MEMGTVKNPLKSAQRYDYEDACVSEWGGGGACVGAHMLVMCGVLTSERRTTNFSRSDTPCPLHLADFHIKHKPLEQRSSHAALLMGTWADNTMLHIM